MKLKLQKIEKTLERIKEDAENEKEMQKREQERRRKYIQEKKTKENERIIEEKKKKEKTNWRNTGRCSDGWWSIYMLTKVFGKKTSWRK